jgi:hypothetical protein
MAEYQQGKDKEEQELKQVQAQQIQVDIETKLAYAQSQKGLAAERVAKIQTDRAVAEDKLSRAEAEDANALLALVKTIKELQSMDMTNLMGKIQMLHSINNLEFDKKAEMREEDASRNQSMTV